MKVSPDGIIRIVAREGERLTAYRDTVGVWTIGVGHTAACGPPIPVPGRKITREESRAALARDLGKFEETIARAAKVTLAQHEFDALVSICFNVGPKFAASTCINLINSGERARAAKAIMFWNKPKEIIGRRTGEMKQFLGEAK